MTRTITETITQFTNTETNVTRMVLRPSTINIRDVLSRYLLVHIKKSLFKDNIEIDIDVRIRRNKTRQEKVLEHNLNILKEIKSEKIYNPHLNPLIN